MNIEELKPVWESYKAVIGQESELSEEDLRLMIASAVKNPNPKEISRRTWLNLGMSVFFMLICCGC